MGGFAGDALPVARAPASVVDCLISHPNVCGRCVGIIAGASKRGVGLVLDAGIVDATRASLGLPVIEYAVTDSPLQTLDHEDNVMMRLLKFIK